MSVVGSSDDIHLQRRDSKLNESSIRWTARFERRPCFIAFVEEIHRPSLVIGPRDLRPFARFASIWAWDAIVIVSVKRPCGFVKEGKPASANPDSIFSMHAFPSFPNEHGSRPFANCPKLSSRNRLSRYKILPFSHTAAGPRPLREQRNEQSLLSATRRRYRRRYRSARTQCRLPVVTTFDTLSALNG